MTNPKTLRFYWLNLQQDLFGTWCVHKIYGGLTNHRGREVWISFKNQADASKALADVEYLKRQRGYVYSDITDVEHFALKPQTIKEVLEVLINGTGVQPITINNYSLRKSTQLF